MDENKRKTISGWIDKASSHLETAKEHLTSPYRVSDSIQASQICVELSVKAALSLLNVPFPRSHGLKDQQLSEIAKNINERQLLARLADQCLGYSVPLPRLLLRMNLWSQFYIEAKYGFEFGHLAPAQELFEKEDADLAAKHATDCLLSARTLLYHPQDKLVELVGR